MFTPNQFLDLCDTVLTNIGKGTLGKHGRAVVEVRPDDRVVQILAGPGSGKTEMLALRVLYQVMVLGSKPERLLVTTFTNRAATELTLRLTERSQQLLEAARATGFAVRDPLVHSVRVGTIHSLCASLLAEFNPDYAAEGFEVIDEIETTVRLAQHLRFLGYNPQAPRVIDRLLGEDALCSLMRPPWKTDGNWPRGLMDRVAFVSRLLALQTETWEPRCKGTGTRNGLEAQSQGITDDLVKLHGRWIDYLERQTVLDFATVQRRFVADQSKLLTHIDHAFVDEFQDTNPVQFELHTSWLTGKGTRLTVVGDDDQSLYRFRGSDIGCFADLGPWATSNSVPYRLERLETNWRSTRSIVNFSVAFRNKSGLAKLSMAKNVAAASNATEGRSVRLLQGPWQDVAAYVASEIKRLGIGLPGQTTTETASVLMFSTSESGGNSSATVQLRTALESEGIRTFNVRSKTAAEPQSPVIELAALVSYLFDPIQRAPVGKGGRMVEVWASHPTPYYRNAAISHTAPFLIPQDHASIQKQFRKRGGRGALPTNHRSDREDVLSYVDDMRDAFKQAVQKGEKIRMTLAGLIARILTFGSYRDCGYTVDLFRQALFTHLLEANTAPTRRTKSPIDAPLTPSVVGGKLSWPKQYWSLLRIMGSLLKNTTLDDEEIEAFSEGAVSLLTFHQAKGLEFDHVYVAGTGRDVSVHSALLTEAFSGRGVKFAVDGGQPITRSTRILELARGDLWRELYVAFTRAKQSLTILHDPSDNWALMRLNPTTEELFSTSKTRSVQGYPSVRCLEFKGAK